jgi:hypothetical protein
VLVGWAGDATCWLRELRVPVADLLAVDWSRVAAGDPRALPDPAATGRLPGPPAAPPGPAAGPGVPAALLVCTNGRRDACCAVLGRPTALALVDSHPGAVWECSHLGGHRFAPTTLVLPTLAVHARVGLDLAETLLRDAAAGRVTADQLRGRSHLARPAQAADALVRSRHAATGAGDLMITVVEGPAGATDPATGTVRCHVTHRDGRSWLVDVVRRTDPVVLRAESCGADALPLTWWDPAFAPA